MTNERIRLKALKFGDQSAEEAGGPTRVVADFPANILYTLARLHGAIPHIVLTGEAAQHSSEFYSFVTGHVANWFYEDGVNDAAPGYNVFATDHLLAWYEAGSKHPEAPEQRLAGLLEMSISDHLGESSNPETNAERRQLAEVMARTVVNYGWQHVTRINPI